MEASVTPRKVYDDAIVIDGLNVSLGSSPNVYPSLSAGGVTAINATMAIWEGFRETLDRLAGWSGRFREHADTLSQGRTADDILQAKTDGKLIFVHISTPWCGWCRKLEAFLDREDVSAILSRRYLIVKIDQDRMLNGVKLRESIPQGSGGVPWHAVLDADGAALVTATGPKGNIGYPVAPHEIAHFMSMLRDTRGDLSDADLDVIRRVLTEFAQKK